MDGPGSFRPVQCDVTKEEEILKMFEIARKEYRGLHILVNNAGVLYAGYLLDSKTEDLRDTMEVNFIGKNQSSDSRSLLQKPHRIRLKAALYFSRFELIN